MEIIKGAHDLAFVALLIAIAEPSPLISPFRKGK
jgi:hypothetical protein